jgi:hypothetical protein
MSSKLIDLPTEILLRVTDYFTSWEDRNNFACVHIPFGRLSVGIIALVRQLKNIDGGGRQDKDRWIFDERIQVVKAIANVMRSGITLHLSIKNGRLKKYLFIKSAAKWMF